MRSCILLLTLCAAREKFRGVNPSAKIISKAVLPESLEADTSLLQEQVGETATIQQKQEAKTSETATAGAEAGAEAGNPDDEPDIKVEVQVIIEPADGTSDTAREQGAVPHPDVKKTDFGSTEVHHADYEHHGGPVKSVQSTHPKDVTVQHVDGGKDKSFITHLFDKDEQRKYVEGTLQKEELRFYEPNKDGSPRKDENGHPSGALGYCSEVKKVLVQRGDEVKEVPLCTGFRKMYGRMAQATWDRQEGQVDTDGHSYSAINKDTQEREEVTGSGQIRIKKHTDYCCTSNEPNYNPSCEAAGSIKAYLESRDDYKKLKESAKVTEVPGVCQREVSDDELRRNGQHVPLTSTGKIHPTGDFEHQFEIGNQKLL